MTTSCGDDVCPQVPFLSERFADSPLGVKFRAASTCERLRGDGVGARSPAPIICDRCVRAGRPRQLHLSWGTLLPRAL